MSKAKVATVWLDGCSGCHMSFLDMDEKLIALAGLVDPWGTPYEYQASSRTTFYLWSTAGGANPALFIGNHP